MPAIQPIDRILVQPRTRFGSLASMRNHTAGFARAHLSRRGSVRCRRGPRGIHTPDGRGAFRSTPFDALLLDDTSRIPRSLAEAARVFEHLNFAESESWHSVRESTANTETRTFY